MIELKSKGKLWGGKLMEKQKGFQVKHQYTLVQALYWISSCALMGYAAVYLQYKGLSNTLIGIVVGGAACISIGVQPLVAQMCESIKGLTVKRLILLMIGLASVLFLILTLVPLPVPGIMVVYTGMYTIYNSLPPLLSAMGMEFINRGYYLNFGFSRGIGSISYAFCAAALGIVIDRFHPGILGYIYVGCAVVLCLSIGIMKDLGREARTVMKQESSHRSEPIGQFIRQSPVFLMLMIGFLLGNTGNSCIGTYTVNIIKNQGGSDTILGLANFISAASEMPMMILFGVLMKKMDCIRILKISAFFFFVKPLVLLAAGSVPAVFVGLAMQGPAFGLFTPAAVYYVNSTIAPEGRVKGQAVFSMITSGAATCVGNLLGGWVQDAFGLEWMLAGCVVIGAIGLVVVLMVPGTEDTVPLRYRLLRWIYHREMKSRG